MADLLNAPIPGQSLTDSPKNYPWERPPEIVDPREAIKFHLDGLTSPEALDNIVEMLQLGVPVKAITQTALTTAQMEGIHSVDVSLIIGNVINEELISIAEEAGVDYKMGDEPDEAEVERKEEQETVALLRRKLDATKEEDAGTELMRQTADMMAQEEPIEGPAPEMMDVEEQEQEMPQMQQRGLMARGQQHGRFYGRFRD